MMSQELRDTASEGPSDTIWCDVIILDEIVILRFLTIKPNFYQILKSDFYG